MLKKYTITEFLAAEFPPYTKEQEAHPHPEGILQTGRGSGPSRTYVLKEEIARITQEVMRNDLSIAGPEHMSSLVFYTTPTGTLTYEKFDYIFSSAKTPLVHVEMEVFTPEGLNEFHKVWDGKLAYPQN